MFRNKGDGDKLEKILGYHFKNKKFLLQALTRTSGLQEGRQKREIGDFQKLEFIGDKVLNLVISDLLHQFNPAWSEGKLTQTVSKFTNNSGPLAQVARGLHLGDFLIMGVGEEKNNRARDNEKVLSDAMEALIGAIWHDTNYDYGFIKQFILKLWTPLGLHPPRIYSNLTEIIRDEEIAPKERIKQFRQAFNSSINQTELIEIFNIVVDECNELEILEIILQTKRIEQQYLDAALFVSIEQGIGAQVELLLRYGANSNANYPTKCFGYEGTVSALQYTLLRAGNTTDYNDTLEIIDLLLLYNADVNWQESITIVTHQEIRAAATEMRQEIRAMFSPETDYDDFSGGGVPLAQLLGIVKANKPDKSEKSAKKIEYKNLNTPLHVAAQTNTLLNRAIFNKLIQKQADVNLQNYKGETPLHILCESFYNNELGSDMTPEIIEDIMKTNINPNIQDKMGNTALHTLFVNFTVADDYLLRDQLPIVVKNLLRLGSDPTIPNNSTDNAKRKADS